MDAEKPLGTVVAGGTKHALVTAFLAQYNNDRGRPACRPRRLRSPRPQAAEHPSARRRGPHQALVTSNLVKLRGTCADGQPVDEPLHTVSAGGSHFAEVRAFLLKYYGADQDPRLEEPLHTSRRATASAW
jgi:DNA (cytosine-5)-methyltransferase 1